MEPTQVDGFAAGECSSWLALNYSATAMAKNGLFRTICSRQSTRELH